MADIDNENPVVREDAPTRNKNIGVMVGAAIIFVLLFIILAYWAFAPSNTPLGNTRQQQQTGNTNR